MQIDGNERGLAATGWGQQQRLPYIYIQRFEVKYCASGDLLNLLGVLQRPPTLRCRMMQAFLCPISTGNNGFQRKSRAEFPEVGTEINGL